MEKSTAEVSISKVSDAAYLCERCKEDSIKKPGFWGCPRGNCEAEKIGIIVTERIFIPEKNKGV